jgi:hypothetical protein
MQWILKYIVAISEDFYNQVGDDNISQLTSLPSVVRPGGEGITSSLLKDRPLQCG